MSKTTLKNFIWTNVFTTPGESRSAILEALSINQLFSKLTNKELTLISKMIHIRHYEPDELVFAQGEKGLGMYIILKGSVEITRSSPEKPNQEFSVAQLEENAFFGELALCSKDSKRTGSAYARGPTTLVGFFKPDLIEIMDRKPEMGVKILFQLSRVVARRLIETNAAFAQSVLETQVVEATVSEVQPKAEKKAA